MRVEVPLGRVRASDAHSLLSVFEISGIVRVVVGEWHTILHQNTGHSDGVEPGANLSAFEIVSKNAIAASGKNDDGCTGILVLGRRIKRERRLADVGQMRQRLPRYKPVGGFGDVRLGVSVIWLRGAVRPKGKGYLLCRGHWRQQSEGKKKMDSHGNNPTLTPPIYWNSEEMRMPGLGAGHLCL